MFSCFNKERAEINVYICAIMFQCLLATRPKNPATQIHNTACDKGWGKGSHSTQQVSHAQTTSPTHSIGRDIKNKIMGGVERVDVCLWQGCGCGSSYGPDLPAAQTPARKRTYTKARSLNLCHHSSGKA